MRISFSVDRNRKLNLLRDGRRREGAERDDELTRRGRMTRCDPRRPRHSAPRRSARASPQRRWSEQACVGDRSVPMPVVVGVNRIHAAGSPAPTTRPGVCASQCGSFSGRIRRPCSSDDIMAGAKARRGDLHHGYKQSNLTPGLDHIDGEPRYNASLHPYERSHSSMTTRLKSLRDWVAEVAELD